MNTALRSTSFQYAAGTVCTSDYLPWTRVLAASFAEHNPGVPFVALVLDPVDPKSLRGGDAFEVITPADTGIDPDEFAWMSMIYSPFELSCAMKPWVIEYLLDHNDAAMYLDSDMCVFGDLSEIVGDAITHGLVLTPHELTPSDPTYFPMCVDQSHLEYGQFNAGFICASQGGRDAIAWWKTALARDCVDDRPNHRFTDQKWLDFVIGYFPFHICRHPGANLAFWNMPVRMPERASDGTYTVDGRPLLFLHFSSFDPDDPTVLTTRMPPEQRLVLADYPVLYEICHGYAQRLREAGVLDPPPGPRPFRHLPNGIALTPAMRSAGRLALVTAERAREKVPRNPFDPACTGDLQEWLGEPSGPYGLSRYATALHAADVAIARHFPAEAPGFPREYQQWLTTEGIRLGIYDPWIEQPVPSLDLDTHRGLVLVHVDEVVQCPEIISQDIAAFDDADNVAFVLWWPCEDEHVLATTLEPLLAQAGIDAAGPELFGVVDPLGSDATSRRVIAVLSRTSPRAGLEGVPHVRRAADLRSLLAAGGASTAEPVTQVA